MVPRFLPSWRLSHAGALRVQTALLPRVRLVPLVAGPRLVAGCDVSFSGPAHRMCAAVVLYDLRTRAAVETALAVRPARWPYIPGLFSFRELPPLIAAFRRLRSTPDLLLFDGHGTAHPRRFGLACHAGVLFDLPSVGCAKSVLVGSHLPPGPARGSWSPLVDGGETIGAALRTRDRVAPVFVSAGHRIDLPGALEVVLACGGGRRLPEPARLAHQATEALRKRVEARPRRAVRGGYPDFLPAGD